MSIVLVGMTFGAICASAALVTGQAGLVEAMVLYALSGNIGSVAQILVMLTSEPVIRVT